MLKTSQKIKRIRLRGKPELTQERLAEVLTYKPETGLFRTKVATGGRRVWDIAGTRNSDGYVSIFIDFWAYRAHRLAWLAMTGEMPPAGYVVDHVNFQRGDNRWSNLRLLTSAENSRHRAPQHCSSTGVQGVHHYGKKFEFAIEHKGQRFRRGGFATVADAARERRKLERAVIADAKADAMALARRGRAR